MNIYHLHLILLYTQPFTYYNTLQIIFYRPYINSLCFENDRLPSLDWLPLLIPYPHFCFPSFCFSLDLFFLIYSSHSPRCLSSVSHLSPPSPRPSPVPLSSMPIVTSPPGSACLPAARGPCLEIPRKTCCGVKSCGSLHPRCSHHRHRRRLLPLHDPARHYDVYPLFTSPPRPPSLLFPPSFILHLLFLWTFCIFGLRYTSVYA